jgi:hypothetical protein
MGRVTKAVRRCLHSRHAVVAIAVLIAFAGAAYAASGGIPGPGGVITGCYNKSTGQLRIINSSKRCNRGLERRLTWNQRGLRGPTGAKGAQGVQGVAGTIGPQGLKGDTGPAGPITGVLPSGVTLRGGFAIRLANGTAGQRIQTAFSFGFTLSAAPTPHYIPLGGTVPPECAGGTPALPAAQPGQLCVFEAATTNITAGSQHVFDEATGTNEMADAFGAGVAADATDGVTNPGTATETFADTRLRGTWAVTAP